MNQAFLFDMDGVLVDSERAWKTLETDVLREAFGSDIANVIGDPTGLSIYAVHEQAVRLGATIDLETYIRRYDEAAAKVYARAPITPGAESLAERLLMLGFKLGLVSASRKAWVDQVLPRLAFADKFEIIVSLPERPNLRPKPSPDGYLAALIAIRADARETVILEDSNPGIESGKASGAYVVGFRGNLADGYEQRGADAYADTMTEVATIAERFALIQQ